MHSRTGVHPFFIALCVVSGEWNKEPSLVAFCEKNPAPWGAGFKDLLYSICRFYLLVTTLQPS
jgi:hypothetical protein